MPEATSILHPRTLYSSYIPHSLLRELSALTCGTSGVKVGIER